MFYLIVMPSINSYQIGDIVELIATDDRICKLKKGNRGKIVSIDVDQELIWVDWETGEHLALLVGIDKFKKINK